MFSKRYSTILFSFFLSIFMTFIVSGVSSFTAIGLNEQFINFWIKSWFRSWLIAFPAIIVIAPLTRKIIQKMTKE
ncbi:DUF2798 domain-containing protein [Alphaproteobacteria bacterium]|nr:DUF2798 domain-containing protein [Alphaproteobacteria bacterium]